MAIKNQPAAHPLHQAFAKANALRNACQWQEAITAYNALHQTLTQSPEIAHNLAVCWLGAGQAQQALRYAQQALQLNPLLWQSQLILAKAQRQLDPSGIAAEQTLTHLLNHSADAQAHAHARLELSELALNVFCNARESYAWVQPIQNTPEFQERAQLNAIIAQLYDRDISDRALTDQAIAYSDKFLNLAKDKSNSKRSKAVGTRGKKQSRPRVGLVSCMFSASPLYYLCFAAFEKLAQQHDLVIFNRKRKFDWASDQFKNIAHTWIDCENDTGVVLTDRLRAQSLDVLFELGGWMDTDALKAVSLSPAPIMYKWVGGQAMTTGLNVFNGYISDTWQTPATVQSFFTEPLVHLPQGYVRYQPPDYLPKPAKRKSAHTAAIIGNPLKVTQATIKRLVATDKTRSQEDFPEIKELRLIDRRYRNPRIRNRIEALLEPYGGRVKFVVCQSHEEFLKEIAKVPWVIDTAPYSAGLTAREALAMGAQLLCAKSPGRLFSSRHGWAAKAAFNKNSQPEPIDLAALWK